MLGQSVIVTRPLLFREVLGSEYRSARAMVLRSYFDASGKPDQGLITVGGLITTVDLWDEKFTSQWNAILEEYGLPYFKMSDYEHCAGVFKDWSKDDPRRHELFRRLSEPMIACRPMALGVSLDMLAWHVYDLRLHAELGVRHPYHLCAHLCLEMAGHLRNNNAPSETQLSAWFDNDDEGAGDLATGFEAMKKMGVIVAEPDTITFPKKGTPPDKKAAAFQAADVIAFLPDRFAA